MIKKFSTLILAGTMLLTTTFSAYAEDIGDDINKSNTMTIGISDIEVDESQAGDTVSVPVEIENNTGFSSLIAVFEFSDSLAYNNYETGLCTFIADYSIDSVVALSAADTVNITEDGVIYYLNFTLPNELSSGDEFDISPCINQIVDIDGNDIECEVRIGKIFVSNNSENSENTTESQTETYEEAETTENIPTCISVGNVYANAGETVKVPVYIENNSGFTSIGLQFDFDESLELTESSFGLIEPMAVSTNNGAVSIVYASSAITNDNGVLLYLSFNVPESAEIGDVYDISVTIDLFSSIRSKDGETISENGSITIQNTEETTETTINISDSTEITTEEESETETASEIATDVTEENNICCIELAEVNSVYSEEDKTYYAYMPVNIEKNQGFKSSAVGIEFEDSVLEYVGVEGGLVSPEVYTQDNRVGFSSANEDIVEDDGVLYTIIFEVKDIYESTNLNIYHAELYDENNDDINVIYGTQVATVLGLPIETEEATTETAVTETEEATTTTTITTTDLISETTTLLTTTEPEITTTTTQQTTVQTTVTEATETTKATTVTTTTTQKPETTSILTTTSKAVTETTEIITSVTTSTTQTSVIKIDVSSSVYLTATKDDVRWISSDTSVATVDSEGKVTGVSAGNVDIFVVDTDGNAAVVKIEVVGNSQNTEEVTTKVPTNSSDEENNNSSIGDMNSDGIINSIDAVAILTIYANLLVGNNIEYDINIADVNSDGKADSIDAVIILKYFAKYIVNSQIESFSDYLSTL